ncbi:MAG: hypothetical protein GYA17_09145 [Chloroflexi bacterium]|nr:hypothetical protein [Chloroflexota bacterium]
MRINKLRIPLAPVLFFVVVLFSYGIYIPWFGLYGDDWIYMWAHHLLGPLFYVDFVSIDRPFSAWIYILSSAVFGDTVWMYHVLLLGLRWLSTVLFWWVLRSIWPEHERAVTWMALLMAVYPGFKQEPISVQFILHFSVLALFLWSLGLMIQAARRPERSRLYTVIALLASALAVFSLEYFVGGEFLRPLILWAVYSSQVPEVRARLRKVIVTWIPYLVVLVLFFIWRVFIFKFPTYQPGLLNSLASNPLTTLYEFALRIARDLRMVTYGAWRQVFSLPDQSQYVLPAIALMVVMTAVVWFLMTRKTAAVAVEGAEGQATWKDWALQAVWVGLLAMLVGGIPIWVAEVPLEMSFPWDRSTLSYLIGLSLFTVGAIYLVVRKPFPVILLSLMVGMAVGFQFQNAVVYRNEQDKMNEFYWQMTWRIPALEPGTIMVFQDVPLNRVGDNSMTPPVNWIYAPDLHDDDVPYKVFDLTIRYGEGRDLPTAEENIEVVHSYRNINFSGSTSNILAFRYNPPGCFRVLGPEDLALPALPGDLGDFLPISKLDQIVVDTPNPAVPPSVVGPEPEHDWCYYFEKADLARQQQDWTAVEDWGEQALAQSFHPRDASEWLPFLEGYIYRQNWDRANQVSQEVMEKEANQTALCATWERALRATGYSLPDNPSAAVLSELGCVP